MVVVPYLQEFRSPKTHTVVKCSDFVILSEDSGTTTFEVGYHVLWVRPFGGHCVNDSSLG